MAETGKVSWLHLTDVHIGQPNEWLWPRMKRLFFNDLEKHSDVIADLEVVVFSGDFVQKGTSEEFEKATSELIDIWQFFSKKGRKPVLLLVPGNHDLVRPDTKSYLSTLTRHWHTPEESTHKNDFWNGQPSDARDEIHACFNNYIEWKKLLPIEQGHQIAGILPGDFSVVLDLKGKKIGCVGLNTTFLQLANGNYEGLLDIHLKQLMAVTAGNPDKWRDELDLGVLMTHQPQSWFHPMAKDQFAEIWDGARFDFHFCGHLHETRVADATVQGGPAYRQRQTASLFGMEKYGAAETKRQFGYCLGQWSFGETTLTEEIWPRIAEATAAYELGADRSFRGLSRTGSCTVSIAISKPNNSAHLGSTQASELRIEGGSHIVVIDRPVHLDEARQRLRKVPRLPLISEKHHEVIRATERESLQRSLKAKRYVWLASDWAMGKDGFLASCLQDTAASNPTWVYRVQCGDSANCDEILISAGVQLGMTIQEFLAAVALIPSAVLIFDDLPLAFSNGSMRSEFATKVEPLFDFCPHLWLVFVARQGPTNTDPADIVSLKSLGVHEIKDYLSNHSKAISGLTTPDNLERIESWSGGLPMHLDRLLERVSNGLSLSDIVDEPNLPSVTSASPEPIPQALKDAINTLDTSEDDVSKRSIRMLKVLSVLKDGESYQSIRRFDQRRPFHNSNIDQLTQLKLIEAVSMSHAIADLKVFKIQGKSLLPEDPPKLLRVPRQVRDYVDTLITEVERNAIVRASTGLFFGEDWHKGKIRLRRSIHSSHGPGTLGGPGNENVIAKHLLVSAIERGDKMLIGRYARLALGYCHKLLSADRFRDVVIAAGGIYHLLESLEFDEHFVDAAHVYSQGLRMMGRHGDAIEVLERAFERGEHFLIPDNKGSMYLTMALCYKGIDKDDEASAAASMVSALMHEHSATVYHANAILIDLKMTGEQRTQALRNLEVSARNRKHVGVANNIAIDLASEGAYQDSVGLLNRVISCESDYYNRARAVVEKATLLSKNKALSQLSDRDRQMLIAAYSYSYGQRIGDLLDRCHTVLWKLMFKEKLWDAILRLFRFSSFIWRLRGTTENENKYINDLAEANEEIASGSVLQVSGVEILYFELRKKALNVKVIDI